MQFINRLVVIVGKLVGSVSRLGNLGAGATWPGEIALILRSNITRYLAAQLRKGIIVVAGTNGKTTTSLMIKKILESEGQRVVHNASGANLLNGIVSSFTQAASWFGIVSADWGVFETDENSLPRILSEFKVQPRSGLFTAKFKIVVVLLNLFRDQLDRYGEVDVISEKWGKALKTLPRETTVILNSDDPGVAHLGKNLSAEIFYFGLNDKNLFLKDIEHATDSTFCLSCGNRLTYEGIYYSHLGFWHCRHCGESRPKPDVSRGWSPLPGLYNRYNTLAAVSVVQTLGIKDALIKKALKSFAPAFGRQEEFMVDGHRVKLFLSKNPAGFNASLRTVLEQKAKILLLVLNDRIPDGRDVSWIWDVDFEMIPHGLSVIVSGDRAYDMGLRIKYALQVQSSKFKVQSYNSKFKIYENLGEAIVEGLKQLKPKDTLYILPTYSAMLEVRKILIGRKIL